MIEEIVGGNVIRIIIGFDGRDDELTIDGQYPIEYKPFNSREDRWFFHASSRNTGSSQIPYAIAPDRIVEIK